MFEKNMDISELQQVSKYSQCDAHFVKQVKDIVEDLEQSIGETTLKLEQAYTHIRLPHCK